MNWGISQQNTASYLLTERGYVAASLQARAQIIMANLEVNQSSDVVCGKRRQWIRLWTPADVQFRGMGRSGWTCIPLIDAPKQMKCLWQMMQKKADNIRNNKD
jgi:hypothetical protein